MVGDTYARYRRPDSRIAAVIDAALGDATTVVNVGAGAGSYEPDSRTVLAVEPSPQMRAQRPAGAAPVVAASAEALPFRDATFDASMTTFSVHQWRDPSRGLREMRRVTSGPVVVLTCDPRLLREFWLTDYAPEVIAIEARRYPALDALAAALGGPVTVQPVPIPIDCADGFNEAYYGRPELLLDAGARLACSAWSFVDAAAHRRFEARLRADLAAGAWDARFGSLRTQPTFEGSLVLVRSGI